MFLKYSFGGMRLEHCYCCRGGIPLWQVCQEVGMVPTIPYFIKLESKLLQLFKSRSAIIYDCLLSQTVVSILTYKHESHPIISSIILSCHKNHLFYFYKIFYS